MNTTLRPPPHMPARAPSQPPRPPRAPANSLGDVLRQHLPLLLACLLLSVICAFALAANSQPVVG